MERNEFKSSRTVKVAKMYYQLEYSQQAIAKELGISRPSVSRLLQEAKKQGIVQIQINDPTEDGQKLTEVIKEKYNLKDCIIVHVPVYHDSVVKEYIGEKAANYVRDMVKSGDVIGTTWGTTLFEVARRIKPKDVFDVKVVQLNGGVSHSQSNTYASDILNYLGKAFATSPHFLPLPAVVDSLYVTQAIARDRHISKVLELGKQANIALFTVGDPNEGSTLVKADYFTKEDLEVLKEKNAVGDICSRFIDRKGNLCNEAINARTIGIELENLRKIESTILVAGGIKKVSGIIGALEGNYANVLITDQFTAKSLIET
ncbi:sugar-binding transcriptional regulator [Virgibacillus byunsanensis]|uniref:Sugar-binding transcriptional regulator n=1 Tax=Virgibacillus byunsanensis TaxID=570945 RepID=A0ABW3LQP8_9BACI